jgi:hypothetical protein
MYSKGVPTLDSAPNNKDLQGEEIYLYVFFSSALYRYEGSTSSNDTDALTHWIGGWVIP